MNGTESCPPAPFTDPKRFSTPEGKLEKKEYLDWSLRDQAAQGLMKGGTESSQWQHILKANTSKEIWSTWCNMYVTNQQSVNIHYHFEEYTRKNMSRLPQWHIAAMLNLGQMITDAGEKLPDIHIVCVLILLLPRNQLWDIIKIQLFNLNSSKLTSAMVSTTLIAESNCQFKERSSEMALLCYSCNTMSDQLWTHLPPTHSHH